MVYLSQVACALAEKDGFADSEKNQKLLLLVVVITERMQGPGNEIW